MAASFSLPTVLANLAAGNQALSLIDGDFTACYNPLVSLNTFGNYYTDIGSANAYAITVSSPQTVSQSAGLGIQFIATNANTGASTLQINAIAAKSIINQDGTALARGQIQASSVVSVVYDGNNYQLQGTPGSSGTFTATITGMTATVTATANYTIIKNVVQLDIPALAGTSNTTACTITGLPTSIQPTSTKTWSITSENNGVITVSVMQLGGGTGTITLFNSTAPTATFTNSGAKGLNVGASVSYTLS